MCMHHRLDATSHERLYKYEKVSLLDIEAPPPGYLVGKNTTKKRACNAGNAVHGSDETAIHRTLAEGY
jgi:hypothetical protein